MVEFRLLGSVDAIAEGGGPVDLGHARQRSVLAVLLVEVGRPVPVDVLIDRVWGQRPPLRARETLRAYTSRLRFELATAGAVLRRRAGGYVVEAEPETVDIYRFRRVVEEARRIEDPVRGAVGLGRALKLWRGRPFAGVDSLWLNEIRDHWEAERAAVQAEWIDRMLQAGRHSELVGVLPAWVGERPLDEQLARQWMLALHGTGRQAEALQVYHDLRARLTEELGVDPDAQLQQQYQSILRGDPAPLASRFPKSFGRNDLPGDIPDFTGRAAEMASLIAAARPSGSPAIVMIDGMAGVGKTALVVHAAHHLADRYPDGRLFIDLHGHSTDGDRVDPMAALDNLLRAIGVPGQTIPPTVDQRAALWRAEIADRRVLLVLDNALDGGQIRPLLPGSAESLTLVTSRQRLADLDGARVLSIDVLSAEQALDLFARAVDDARVVTDPAAAAEVAALCGHLPLAIRVAAARLRARPAWTVAYLADRLRDERRRLGELTIGNRSVAAAFGLSYRHLDSEQQRMFRLLGLITGPDIDTSAAAALAATNGEDAERLLEALVDTHLLEQPRPGRYQMHDLVHQYAHAIALATETPDIRQRTQRRLVDFYLRTAYAADRLLRPARLPIPLDAAVQDCRPGRLADHRDALEWMDTEHCNVIAAQRLATTHDWHDAVWQLAWSLRSFHNQRGYLRNDVDACLAGLAAADRLDDPFAQAHALRALCQACIAVGRWDEMLEYSRRALTLDERTGDLAGQANTHHLLAVYWDRYRGDLQQALEHCTRALHLFQRLERPDWEGEELNAVAWFLARQGDYDRAFDYATNALDLCRRHHNRLGEAMTLDTLGYIARHTGDWSRALDYYRQAIAIDRELGMDFGLTATLEHLGHTYLALGQPEQTRTAWREALEVYRIQHRTDEADRIIGRLATLGNP